MKAGGTRTVQGHHGDADLNRNSGHRVTNRFDDSRLLFDGDAEDDRSEALKRFSNTARTASNLRAPDSATLPRSKRDSDS